jgi:hypothetical protein
MVLFIIYLFLSIFTLVLLHREIERIFFKFNLNDKIYQYGVPMSYLFSYAITKPVLALLSRPAALALTKVFGFAGFALPSSVCLIVVFHYAGRLSWLNSLKLSVFSSVTIVSIGIFLGMVTPYRNVWLLLVLLLLTLALFLFNKLKTRQNHISELCHIKSLLIAYFWALFDWCFRWGVIILCIVLHTRVSLFFLLSLKLRSIIYKKMSLQFTEDGIKHKGYTIKWAGISSITYNYALTTIDTIDTRITVPGLPEDKITLIVENAKLNHYIYSSNKTTLTKNPNDILTIAKPSLIVKSIALLQCISYVFMILFLVLDALWGNIGYLFIRIALFSLICTFTKNDFFEFGRASFRDALARLFARDITISYEGIGYIKENRLMHWKDITHIDISLAKILISSAMGEQYIIPNNQVIRNLIDSMQTKSKLQNIPNANACMHKITVY